MKAPQPKSPNGNTRVTLAVLKGDIERLETVVKMYMAEQRRVTEQLMSRQDTQEEKLNKRLDNHAARLKDVENAISSWKGYLAAGFALTTILVSIINLAIRLLQ